MPCVDLMQANLETTGGNLLEHYLQLLARPLALLTQLQADLPTTACLHTSLPEMDGGR